MQAGTQIEIQSVELNRMHVHVTMFVFVPSSDRCIVCHMYNWCVQVRRTCVQKKMRHTIVYRAMCATMQACAQV